MKSCRRALLLAAMTFSTACAALIGTGAAEAADPVKIRLSYVVPISNWADMVAQKKDLTRNLGKSCQIEVTRFAGTPPMITALAAGALDSPQIPSPTPPTRLSNPRPGHLPG